MSLLGKLQLGSGEVCQEGDIINGSIVQLPCRCLVPDPMGTGRYPAWMSPKKKWAGHHWAMEAHGGRSFSNQRSNGIRSKMDTVGTFAKIDSRELASLELLRRL